MSSWIIYFGYSILPRSLCKPIQRIMLVWIVRGWHFCIVASDTVKVHWDGFIALKMGAESSLWSSNYCIHSGSQLTKQNTLVQKYILLSMRLFFSLRKLIWRSWSMRLMGEGLGQRVSRVLKQLLYHVYVYHNHQQAEIATPAALVMWSLLRLAWSHDYTIPVKGNIIKPE